MKINTKITEDTVTPYLNYIREALATKKDDIVKEAGKTLAYLVYNQGEVWGFDEYGSYGMQTQGKAPFETGALLSSAFNPNQQILTSEEHNSILELYWTGMYADYSWKEFRSDRDTSKPPERDYAYYQETGIDMNASSSDAKHKGFFKETVNDKSIHQKIKYDIGNEYMKVLMKK